MDLWLVFVDKNATEKRKVWYIRACLVIFAVIAFVMCRFFPNVLAIQNYVYALYSSAITPALFAALLWKGVTKQGAVASIVSGTVITLVNEFSGKPINGIASAIFAIPRFSYCFYTSFQKLLTKGLRKWTNLSLPMKKPDCEN